MLGGAGRTRSRWKKYQYKTRWHYMKYTKIKKYGNQMSLIDNHN